MLIEDIHTPQQAITAAIDESASAWVSAAILAHGEYADPANARREMQRNVIGIDQISSRVYDLMEAAIEAGRAKEARAWVDAGDTLAFIKFAAEAAGGAASDAVRPSNAFALTVLSAPANEVHDDPKDPS